MNHGQIWVQRCPYSFRRVRVSRDFYRMTLLDTVSVELNDISRVAGTGINSSDANMLR